MAEKVRVGMIGCGGIARGHAARLIKNPDAEIVALADPSEESIARLKEFIQAGHGGLDEQQKKALDNVPVFKDYREMLDKVEMDAVEIATPHTLHFEQAMESINRGLHVCLEKPMVCCVEHANKLIANAEEKKRIIVVSYQRHYQPQYRYIKKVVDEGGIGKVAFVSALQCQNWKKGTAGKWRQVPELSGGGQLNDSGSHLIDIILWTTGLAVEEVFAYIDNCGTPVDINSALALKFKESAQGTVSIVGDAPAFYEDFTIWGEEGILFYRNGQLSQCGIDGKIFQPEDLPPASDPDTNFIDAILGRDEVWAPPICGLRVIELTEAAWKSAEKGCAVPVGSLG
ncbi:MAG: Gfo/Idh/MocA family oxidoreductase [Armatimonadetes bacterium]|nr:Gfo/Idh/MocA family oxidoreductase [Armatimonadota bacterium]